MGNFSKRQIVEGTNKAFDTLRQTLANQASVIQQITNRLNGMVEAVIYFNTVTSVLLKKEIITKEEIEHEIATLTNKLTSEESAVGSELQSESAGQHESVSGDSESGVLPDPSDSPTESDPTKPEGEAGIDSTSNSTVDACS